MFVLLFCGCRILFASSCHVAQLFYKVAGIAIDSSERQALIK